MAEINSVAPPQIMIDELTSGSEFVKSRRMVEILPDSQSSYGSNGNYRATFNIGSSGAEFLDSLNSYFKCDLVVTTPADGTYAVRAHLDEGGIHSLIKSITIQTRNGTRIEHIDNYNKLYALMRNYTMSKNHVDSVQSHECGDSMAFRPYLDPDYLYQDAAAIRPVDEEEFILLPQFTHDSTPATNSANINASFRSPLAVLNKPARLECANGSSHKLSFKLLSDFLSHMKYLPLPMMNQLQIVFEFERADLGLFLTKRAVATGIALHGIVSGDALTYSINNFRYVASMVEMSDVVLSEYEKAYNGPGISIPFQSHRAFRNTLTGTAGSFEIQFGVNSARYLLITLMANHSFTESTQARSWHSNSWFLKDKLKNYRVQSGGKVFPANSPIDCETDYAAEAFTQTMIALNQHQNLLSDTSIKRWELNKNNVSLISMAEAEADTTSVEITDATKFAVGVDLTDIDGFSGVNTTGNNLVVDLNFTDGPETYGRNALSYICYDVVMTLSRDFGVVVRY